MSAARTLLEDGVDHLHLYWHSQSHAASSPFVKNDRDLTTFFRKIDAVVNVAHRMANVRMGTVEEVARALDPGV